ncbi:GPW/gp25 family protein [Aquimarina sp. RZ0]|uniref:GPW/gp25 family protein n=1 Tax=Aquimarina sp. RZ0 TaxID=2607730 RepID=UPI0011F0F56D|nr:GPW/gp25 family protein [Aquimarina sp. RZ0]KAA1245328.1 GPW/gp25 family protein [Aquimarina sp. RZ0]
MVNSYYKLPLDTLRIVKNKEIDSCDLKQSIVSFIHLITTSYFGECTFDESFGCSIWNVDFDNLTSTNKLRNTITESLIDSIVSQEKRLKRVNVEVTIEQEEFTNRGASNRIKKRVDIKVNGIISRTNEDFTCIERFYIAPLSF